MTLLVGSAFAKNDEVQLKWLDLQLRFLKASTKDYDHVVSLNLGPIPSSFADRTKVILSPDSDRCKGSSGHLKGLKNLLSYFIQNEHRYDRFLFIDSDAFPVRVDWQNIIEERAKNHDIAIPIRFENLEQRLHSSILYAKPQALKQLEFAFQSTGPDLIGGREGDIGCGDYQNKIRDKVCPLLRSNKTNVHPLVCGMYSDLFYHHCCGSGRHFNMRARSYWQHIATPTTDIGAFTDKLFEDPNSFISEIGWNHGNYGKV